MTSRRGSRFGLEVLYLVVLAGVLVVADLRPVVIAVVMIGGWLIVAAFERSAWRERAHFAAGLPPRYHVPPVDLPPAQPLELVTLGYPEAQRDEAPTWIASAELRAELLGEWPVAISEVETEPEDTEEAEPAVDVLHEDRWLVAELPPAPEPVVVAVRMARYTIDPLAEPAPRRRFGRGQPEPLSTLEVPARPERRLPPGHASREDGGQ